MNREELIKLFPQAYRESKLPLPKKVSGKVRDWYPLDNKRRLLITTDRLSAFDRILNAVPFKGQVLNQLSAWWFKYTEDIIENHIIELPDPNALIAREVRPLPVEVVVRGYITGVTQTALWYQYAKGERVIYGHTFPDGLKKNQALPKAIITPTTKGGPSGHDERLTCDEVVEKNYLSGDSWNKIQDAALALFERGQKIASDSGLILVDTKYEFGMAEDGIIILIDEVHTPDSSRFWKADTYPERFNSGEEPENYDKEFIRLAYSQKGYRGDGDIPDMPDELWAMCSERYISIYEFLTKEKFVPGMYPVEERLIKNLQKAGVFS